MLRILLVSLFILSNAYASLKDVEVIRYKDMSEEQGVAFLKQHLEEGQYVNRTRSFAFEKVAPFKTRQAIKSNNYSNGDYVILWGVGSETADQSITESEYKGIWRVMNYLSLKNFRVVMNVRSTADDLADALSSETSSVVLYSSHGNRNAFYDFNLNPIPADIFSHRAANVYQVIISACYSMQALKNYEVPEDLKVFSWYGLTNPTELVNFLVGDDYTGFEGKAEE